MQKFESDKSKFRLLFARLRKERPRILSKRGSQGLMALNVSYKNLGKKRISTFCDITRWYSNLKNVPIKKKSSKDILEKTVAFEGQKNKVLDIQSELITVI